MSQLSDNESHLGKYQFQEKRGDKEIDILEDNTDQVLMILCRMIGTVGDICSQLVVRREWNTPVLRGRRIREDLLNFMAQRFNLGF